ncbi:LAGLIDADG family homing endonuclease [Patescibacteria group bacterium]|nr:LAGLIDADG family homing endonuclease [Patescibacteria group bacterium]
MVISTHRYMPSDKASIADNQQERLKFIGWIVGFVDGEGCFSISIFKNRTSKCGFQVMPEFVVTQGEKSLDSLKRLKTFFNCGNIYVNHRYDNHKENIHRYCVRNFNDLENKIIPFFRENQLLTAKVYDFKLFCEVVELIKKRQHLTIEGVNYIKKLKNPQRPHAECRFN